MSNKRTYGSGGPGLFQKELVPQLPCFGAGAPLGVTQKSPQNKSETIGSARCHWHPTLQRNFPNLRNRLPPSECVCLHWCRPETLLSYDPPSVSSVGSGRWAGPRRGGAGRGGTVRALLFCFCVRVRTCCMSDRGMVRKTVGAGFNRIAPQVMLWTTGSM